MATALDPLLTSRNRDTQTKDNISMFLLTDDYVRSEMKLVKRHEHERPSSRHGNRFSHVSIYIYIEIDR